MSALVEMFKGLAIAASKVSIQRPKIFYTPVRYRLKERKIFTEVPKLAAGKSFRRKVHFPEEYTVQPLKVTNLGGRDPETGRKVSEGIGGGIKHKYHWIKWTRDGPTEGPPQEEKVIRIIKCGCRTADVALVAFKDEMKYILATENMKPGDIIRTSKVIPKTFVRAYEGDAYPVGALPLGTLVHNIQIHPSTEITLIHSAGCCGIIKKNIKKKVTILLPSKREITVEPECMATVGRLSNILHGSTPIGSAQRSRELGNRPRSGLWHRKTGRFGRKIRPLKPLAEFKPRKPPREIIRCTHPNFRI